MIDLAQSVHRVWCLNTFDPSGNACQRLDAGAGVLSSDLYDGFGGRQSTAATPDVFGFAGQWGGYYDAQTGLVLMTHRFYDPSTGRFLTRDPLGYAGGVNLYAYCANDPVNRADPKGLDFLHQGDPGHHSFCILFGAGVGIFAGGVVAVTITGITGGVGAVAGGVVGGAVAGGFGQAVNNMCEGEPPEKDVPEWCAAGAMSGAAGPIIGKGITAAGGTP